MQKHRKEHRSVATLLVVDDDPPVLEATTWALRNAGFRSYSAPSIEAALTILASHDTVSGVILDRGLAGASLAGVVARLREIAPGVTLVGTSGTNCRDEFLDAGADHFLPKPWTTNQLVALFRGRPPDARI